MGQFSLSLINEMIQKESIDQEVFDPWQDIGELVESQCQEKGRAKSHVIVDHSHVDHCTHVDHSHVDHCTHVDHSHVDHCTHVDHSHVDHSHVDHCTHVDHSHVDHCLLNDSGTPNEANIFLKLRLEVKDVIVDRGFASIHFELASITMSNMLPCAGPAKPACNLTTV